MTTSILFTLADKKTARSFEALGEAFDVESEVYCRRRSGNAGLPWSGVRASRYPVHSGRRPPSLSASSGGAPPCLSPVFRFWVFAIAVFLRYFDTRGCFPLALSGMLGGWDFVCCL